MGEWSNDELRWLRRLRKALSGKPDAVHLYTTDGDVVACKQGVPSNALEFAAGGFIMSCCMLSDAHDDCAERMMPLPSGNGDQQL